MIYYFGDSHTAGIGTSGSPKPEMWNHIPYSTYLTNLLNIGSKNFAEPGKNFVLNVISLIEQLSDIEKNASIVLFQTQFFCNSILKYNDKNFYSKDIVLTSSLINSSEIYENDEFGITKEDSLSIVNWSSKFEERRSLYELDIVINVFNYLKSKGIKCYILYWIPAFNLELPDNEFIIKYEDKKYATDFEKPTTFNELTNGEWNDYHTTNDWNERLAEKIYNFIWK